MPLVEMFSGRLVYLKTFWIHVKSNASQCCSKKETANPSLLLSWEHSLDKKRLLSVAFSTQHWRASSPEPAATKSSSRSVPLRPLNTWAAYPTHHPVAPQRRCLHLKYGSTERRSTTTSMLTWTRYETNPAEELQTEDLQSQTEDHHLPKLS